MLINIKYNREKFGTTVDADLLDGLRDLSTETRIPMSRLTDEALEDILEKYERKKQLYQKKEGVK